MTKAEEAEMREAMNNLLLSATVVNKALAYSIEHPPAGARKEAPWWVSPTATVLGVLLAVFGVQYVPKAQSAQDRAVAILEERVKLVDRLEREVRLQQQYQMNLHIWFADRGIKGVPVPPKLSLEENR
jgi:Fimbrial assembly protein (PilN).